MKKIGKYLIIFWISFFLLVFAMSLTRHASLDSPRLSGSMKEFVLFFAELPANTLKLISEGTVKPLVIENANSLKGGFTFSKKYIPDNDHLLISTWDDTLQQCIVKLLRIRDGKVLHLWAPDIDSLNQFFNNVELKFSYRKQTKSGTLLYHPLLLGDGSLLVGAGTLFKIDKHSNIVWTNPAICHHSIILDAERKGWFCSINSSSENAKKYQIRDDAIKQIDLETGKILFEKSVFDLLMENGYNRAVFFINPSVSMEKSALDMIHLNYVNPVLEDSRYWKKGDLFLSIRQQNLIVLYRPSTNKIIWSQNGPWLKQHCVTILDSTRIGVFGNNVIDALYPNEDDRLIEQNNNQYVYDFSTNTITTPYDSLFKKSPVKTIMEGESRILKDGRIFIEDTNHGRLLLGDKNSELWSYTEKVDDRHISLFGWCSYISGEEYSRLSFINSTQK